MAIYTQLEDTKLPEGGKHISAYSMTWAIPNMALHLAVLSNPLRAIGVSRQNVLRPGHLSIHGTTRFMHATLPPKTSRS